MIENDLGQQLHSRATSGESLTADEQEELNAWYRQMDDEETEWLANLPPLPDIGEIQARIDQTLALINRSSQRIRTIEQRNAILRQENEMLKSHLQVLWQQTASKRETQHAQGYARQPQDSEEVVEWFPEQDWGVM